MVWKRFLNLEENKQKNYFFLKKNDSVDKEEELKSHQGAKNVICGKRILKKLCTSSN